MAGVKITGNITLCCFDTGQVALANDRNLPERAVSFGTLEIERLQFLPQVMALKPRDVAVDIGAFIGDTTISLLRQGCDVYAFEPYFDAYACLCINAPAAHKFHAPIGNGEHVLLEGHARGDNMGMRLTTVTDSDKGIPTLRIDDLMLPGCEFMKVDCEGHEVFALRGAEHTIRRFNPVMLVECFPELLQEKGHSPAMLHSFIESMGYTVQPDGHDPVRQDLVCIPK